MKPKLIVKISTPFGDDEIVECDDIRVDTSGVLAIQKSGAATLYAPGMWMKAEVTEVAVAQEAQVEDSNV